MGSEWRPYKIDDLVIKRNQGVNTTTEKVKYSESGMTVIRANNISGEGIDWSNCVYVDTETFVRIKNPCKPKKGDILYTNIGSQFGVAAKVDSDEEFVIAWNVLRIQTSDLVDVDFLIYLLNNPRNRNYIQSLNASSTMPFVSGKVVGELKFLFPKLREQFQIKSLLRPLDNNIELNRQTNQTLEQMAQALFKSWFVDFDPVIDNALAADNPIPDELQERAERRQQQLAKPDHKPLPDDILQLFPSEFELTEELGWVPKGWKVGSLLKSIELIGGGTPKTRTEEYWGGNIPWFSVVDAPNDSDVYVIDTEKHVTQEGVDNSSTKVLRKGTTIISARGTVGKCALVAKPMAMNQSCYGIQGKNNVPDEYVYYLIRCRVSDLQQRGHGSVFNTITRDTFESICSPLPSELVMTEFAKLVEPMFQKILANGQQTVELAKLRDTLLPKLISGELRLPSGATEQELVDSSA